LIERIAGVLAHPTALAGRFGIGDLGPEATRFLDWAAESGFGLWQTLPLGPTGLGNSPYTSPSSFAGNPLLISPQRLVHSGWLPQGSLDATPSFAEQRVDFGAVAEWKQDVLVSSWAHFRTNASPTALRALERFIESHEQAVWLEDWALYAALKQRNRGAAWTDWDAPLRSRDPGALDAARRELKEPMAFARYVQFLFHRQWEGLHRAARLRGISLMGDLPYYVAHDSADVWAHQDCFRLDERGHGRKQAGVPPDYFSDSGQLWGNPTYDWERMQQQGYRWWIDRIRGSLQRVDCLRLDHFRAFSAYWEVDAQAQTAKDGRWAPGPGASLFEALSAELGALPLIAEDLGEITDDVVELRDTLELPRMHVLQFAFGDDDNEHRPQRHRRNSVVYTGTHDNDTTRGWFDGLTESERARVLRELDADSEAVVSRMIEAAYESPARMAVIPLQDLLQLDSAARMNRPGVAEGNWEWRVSRSALTLQLASQLRELARRHRRVHG